MIASTQGLAINKKTREKIFGRSGAMTNPINHASFDLATYPSRTDKQQLIESVPNFSKGRYKQYNILYGSYKSFQ